MFDQEKRTIRVLADRGVSILYVSHDLGEVASLCDAVTVLRDGRVVADLAPDEVTHERLVGLPGRVGGDRVGHRMGPGADRLAAHEGKRHSLGQRVARAAQQAPVVPSV